MDGLLLHIPFDDDFSEHVFYNLYDAGPHEMEVYLENADQVITELGAVYQAMGIANPYVEVPTNGELQSLTTTFTVAFWIKLNQGGSGARVFIRFDGNLQSGNVGIRVEMTSTFQLRIWINGTSTDTGERLTLNNALAYDGNWRHFIITFNGTTTSLYLNNQLQNSTNNHSGRSLAGNTSDLRINLSNSLSFYDDFFLFDRVITEGERLFLYELSPERGPKIDVGPVFKRIQMQTTHFSPQSDGIISFMQNGRLQDDAVHGDSSFPSNNGSAISFPPLSNYYEDDSVITAVAGRISSKITMDFLTPSWTGSGPYNGRCEAYSQNSIIKGLKTIWWSVSYYFPSGSSALDPIGEIVFQWHNGIGGSPPCCFIHLNGRFHFQLRRSQSGFVDYMTVDLGEAVRDTWHHFVIKCHWDFDINIGKCTVWKDNKLARLHNPNTGDPWIVPTDTTSGISNDFIANSHKGFFTTVVDDGAGDVNVMDWEGFTWYDTDHILKYPKWGFYKSQWASYYNQDTAEPLNLDNPSGDFYIPPENRVKSIHIANVNFAFDEGYPDYKIYRELSVDNNDPLDYPSWFETEPTE